jgi:hypothetical protein
MWSRDLETQLELVEQFFIQYYGSGDVMSFPWESNVREMHPLELLTFKTEAISLYRLTAKWLAIGAMKIHRNNQDVIRKGQSRKEREEIFQKVIRSSKSFGGEAIAVLHRGIELWMVSVEEEIERRGPGELKQALDQERRSREE